MVCSLRKILCAGITTALVFTAGVQYNIYKSNQALSRERVMHQISLDAERQKTAKLSNELSRISNLYSFSRELLAVFDKSNYNYKQDLEEMTQKYNDLTNAVIIYLRKDEIDRNNLVEEYLQIWQDSLASSAFISSLNADDTNNAATYQFDNNDAYNFDNDNAMETNSLDSDFD